MRLWIGPILRDGGPLRAQTLLIGVGILDDESLHPLRMRQEHAETDRPAIVMKVEGAFADFELIEQVIHRRRQMIKCVRIGRWWWSLALTEPRKVWCHQMITGGKQGNERIELARGGRKPVQQHDRWRILRAGF